MLYTMLQKIYKYFNRDAINNVYYERMPVSKQKEFIKKLPIPKDDFQQSYNKYKCFCEYCYYKRKWILSFYNIGAFIIYPFLFEKLKKQWKHCPKNTHFYDAVIENVPRLPNTDILPDEIKKQYANIIEIKDISYKNIYLNKNAVQICKEIHRRYFFTPYFRIITMMKLAQFSQYIEEFNPKAIIFYGCEREFAGPLQTHLCESCGVKYISFMHGDYLYQLCFAFQKFTHYYIWDEAYRHLFTSLKCSFPMTVYRPEKLNGIAKSLDERDCMYFATYYFSDETKNSIEIIHSIFDLFNKAGLRCKVRPHPRFSDISVINKFFNKYEIENLENYSLKQSIEDSLYIIGLNTTVLSQAYFSNKKIVIDDVSMKKQYSELKEKKYIMLNRKHKLLSQLIQEVTSKNLYDYTYKFFDKGGK